jgi:hypothetical protein
MKPIFKTKSFMISLFFLVLAVVSFFIQNTFYGYIDKNGILRDSIFLPLSFISLLLAGMALFISIIFRYYQSRKKFEP